MNIFIEIMLVALFVFEIGWSIGFGTNLCLIFIENNLSDLIKSFKEDWKMLNFLGKICKFLLGILSIPAFFLGGIVAGFVSITTNICDNEANIFYKKEEEV